VAKRDVPYVLLFALVALVVTIAVLIIYASWANPGSSTSPQTTQQGGVEFYFYIYGAHWCPHCQAMESFLKSSYGEERVYFCDVDNATCNSLFTDFVKAGVTRGYPTTFLVYNHSVAAIVIGEFKVKSQLDQLMTTNTRNEIPVYYPDPWRPVLQKVGYVVFNGTHADFIAKYLNPLGPRQNITLTIMFQPIYGSEDTGTGSSQTPITALVGVLPALVFLGFLDSINPCTIMLYFTFTVSCLSARRLTLPPLIFLALIYVGYFAIGYGLLYALLYIPSWIFLVLALLMGLYTMARAGKSATPELKCELCEKIGRFGRLLANPYSMAVVLALFSLTVLLPCTAGPLVAFTAILAKQPQIIRVPALLLYNVVFITPLLAVFIAVFYLKREKRVAAWLKKHSDVLEFLAGLLLVLVALILLFSSL